LIKYIIIGEMVPRGKSRPEGTLPFSPAHRLY
jgi:hypothetical protein